MEEEKYNLIQVIGMLKLHPNMKFRRVGDRKFIVERGKLGDLTFSIEAKSEEFCVRDRILPIFNYLQDYFVINEV